MRNCLITRTLKTTLSAAIDAPVATGPGASQPGEPITLTIKGNGK